MKLYCVPPGALLDANFPWPPLPIFYPDSTINERRSIEWWVAKKELASDDIPSPEPVENPKFGDVWVFAQLRHPPFVYSHLVSCYPAT